MLSKQDIKSTLRVEPAELQEFLSERPTMPVSYAEMSDLLFQDVMSDLETENFQVETLQ